MFKSIDIAMELMQTEEEMLRDYAIPAMDAAAQIEYQNRECMLPDLTKEWEDILTGSSAS